MYRLFHLNERGAIWHSIKQECSWFMGNLGFMKSKPLVCRAFAENRRKSLYPSPLFYGFPRPQLYPHGKRRCSAPDAPAQQAEADLARIKEVRSCRKSNGISKRSNESVLKFFDYRFSLIFRAFPAFCFSVIRCADHKNCPDSL